MSLGWIHSLDRYLRRLTIGAFAGTRNAATRNPSLLRKARSANGHSDHNFECILLCGALATGDYFLGGLGRCRKRTPGPPPFSSMNSTPATSKARRTAKSLAVVIDVS